MAITLDEVKTYLRIDLDIEDAFLRQCMKAADAYLAHAVDDFESRCKLADFEATADIVRFALISEMYTNRDCRGDNRQSFPYHIRSMILQLQNHRGGEPP